MTFAADKAAIEARATTLLSQATSFLTALQEQANTILMTGTTVLPEQYDYASVPVVNFPVVTAVRPTITGLNLPAPPEAPSVSFSSIAPIALPVDDLLAPTSTFSFAEAAYESILLDPLKVKLLDNLSNGGYGIETADEIALFNRARDREVEAMMSRIADAGRGMAARGFPLPPGELALAEAAAYQEMQDKVSSASRDITLRRSELFVDNRKFTITEVRQLEAITMNYWNAVQERALNAARYSCELGILVYNALLERFKTRMAGAKIAADVNVSIAQVDTARATAAFEIFRSQVAAYEAQLRSVIEPGKLQVDLYQADVALARVENDAFLGRAGLQQKVIEATVQQNIQISNMTIENAKTRLAALTSSIGFRTGALKYASENFFAQLTALLSSINVLTVESTTA